MNDQERFALSSLTDLLREGKNPEAARLFLSGIGMSAALITRALELYDDLARGVREMKEPRVLFDGTRVPQPWYSGPTPKDVYWPALERHLSAQADWNGTPLDTLDRSSSKVVAFLEPPYAREIRTRGLVVGYVQSGKTANFTAVISKAADAGYRLFIVLSGIHNSLRRQTQLRLDEQLVELNRELWIPLTTEERDFGSPIKATPLLAHPAHRILAVVKKNGARLNNLKVWLEDAHKDGVLDRCPVLIIDDEADQASPNTVKGVTTRETINKYIVGLLRFPRVAYVGYTATPFATFFIDPQYPADLYPRHFIVDLPRADDYFGPESLFGREPRTPDEPEVQGLDMIRTVNDKELPQLVPPRRVKGAPPFKPEMTESLSRSLHWFLLAATARRLRDGTPRHTTMLIHTSERVETHNMLWRPVVDELLRLNSALASDSEKRKLAELWEEECDKVDSGRWGHQRLSSSDVVAAVPQTIALLGSLSNRDASDCGVIVDNSFSPRRLVYDDNNPLPVIVIGGNTLSRGLTLAGLVSSFFVRRVGTYDTLLQMGRWFGYRRGYEDLPRMWVTKRLKEQFRFLAGVEDQIRGEIRRYEEDDVIPAEIPVRVRTNPDVGLAITSFDKMRKTRDIKMSYSGQRPQTIIFRTDPSWLERNIDAAKSVISAALASGSHMVDKTNRIVVRDVPVALIMEFLGDGGYQFQENTQLQREALTGYIKAQNALGELGEWNIAVISRRDNPYGDDLDLGVGRPINLIARSQLSGTSTPDTVNIGVLTSQVDWVADLDMDDASSKTLNELRRARTKSRRAVLLLYPVARNSPAKTEKGASLTDKIDLNVQAHVIGVAIAFPVADRDPAPQDFKVVRMPSQLEPNLDLEAAEEEEEDDEMFVAAATGDDNEGSQDDIQVPT